MDDQQCPRCKTTKYRNPQLKLMVNVCGHALCENCVELLFVRGSGSCPQCNTALRRNNFRLQLFEDPTVEKEVDIRKSVLRVYNKKQDDFPSLRDYNDYLEEIEDIVFSLTYNVDAEDTKRRMEIYKKENQDSIKKNRSKLSQDEAYIEELLLQEKAELEFHRKQNEEEEQQQQRERQRHKEALITELMVSDMPASDIVAATKKEIENTEQQRMKAATTGLTLAKTEQSIPPPIIVQGEIYEYIPLELDICGPELPSSEDLDNQGFIKHIRGTTDAERGGGFVTDVACQRVLQEAYCGLFFSPPEYQAPMNTSMEVT